MMEYYNNDVEEIYLYLNTSEAGLKNDDAMAIMKHDGPNELKLKNNLGFFKIVINQFKDFLVWLLIASAFISFLINKDEYIDSILIVLVVLINAILGIAEEIHARNTLKKISALETPETLVKRDGIFKMIPASEVVKGDIVRLEAGFLVPADIRIISSYELKVLEAPLTGEEVPVDKNNKKINSIKQIHDHTNMLFKGTFISSGYGIGVVVRTGNDTEIGQILKRVVETKSEKTPLEASLDKVSKVIGMIIIGICLVVYALELFITKDILSSFSLAISLSVAAIPEGLQSVLTTVMAISVLKMSKNKAIVKRMPIAQALGAINIIACDKTGTITTGHLEIAKYVACDNNIEKLKLSLSLASANSVNQINRLLYQIHDEPQEMIAFDSKNKYEILIYKSGLQYKAYIKGAFDVLYGYASNKNEALYNTAIELAKNMQRVLFVGTKKQAQECVKEAAEKSGMYYVDQRWLGGMLTNFGTIRKRIDRLNELETMQEDGTFDVLPKKEVIILKKEMEKLQKNLGGIKDMKEMPGVMFVVDPKKERIAILEARKLGIPVVGLVDTNCNPEDVDYAIPGNDDAIRAVKLIADVMANAIIEGRQGEALETETEEAQISEEEPTSIEEVAAQETVEE